VATIRQIEKRVRRIEGFDVVILDRRYRDVRGDLAGQPQYPYARAMSDGSTVAKWKRTRFQPNYAGFRVDVVDPDGRRVDGHTLLQTLRYWYAA
jgi:hypothetical protein